MKLRQLLLCLVCLAASQILAIAVFAGCTLQFGWNPFSLYVNLIISVGGLLFGLLGSLGAYPAARLAGAAPTKRLLALMILCNGVGIIIYKGLPYFLAGDTGAGGFFAQFDAMMAHSHMRFTQNSDPSDIGRSGYLLLALDFAWAALGAGLLHKGLSRVPHCHDCGVYFRERGKHALRFHDVHSTSEHLSALPFLPHERADALMRLRGDNRNLGKGNVLIDLTRRECPSCRKQSMTEAISIHNGDGFVPQERQTYFWLPNAASRAAAPSPARSALPEPPADWEPTLSAPIPPQPAPSSAPAVRTFGRKAV